MKYLAALLFTFLLGCANPPDSSRLDIRIENKTEKPIILKVGSGIFSSRIDLAPGEKFDGYVDMRIKISKARIVIEEGE